MAERLEWHRVASADHEDAHRLHRLSRVHHCPEARRSLRVESRVQDVGMSGHLDFLRVGDLDRVFVYRFHCRLVILSEDEQGSGLDHHKRSSRARGRATTRLWGRVTLIVGHGNYHPTTRSHLPDRLRFLHREAPGRIRSGSIGQRLELAAVHPHSVRRRRSHYLSS